MWSFEAAPVNAGVSGLDELPVMLGLRVTLPVGATTVLFRPPVGYGVTALFTELCTALALGVIATYALDTAEGVGVASTSCG
jgi:hypothetical protein